MDHLVTADLRDRYQELLNRTFVEDKDTLKWCPAPDCTNAVECAIKKKDLAKKGNNQKIVIFGVSMGGATTMMTSGIKMPKQVKAYVEDCGYTDVKSEFLHEAKDLYSMPGPVATSAVTLLSGVSKSNLGFYLGDASAIKQLKKNKLPMLFIHGGKDNFVPTKMVY